MQSTMTRRPSEQELRRLGIQVTVSGDLAALRAKMLLTKNAMARQVGISIGALTAYENALRGISPEVGLRIGEWYWGAITALQDAIAEGIPVHTMIPSCQAAQYLHTPHPDVEEMCADGRLRCELLGVLGYYVYADELPGKTAERVARGRRVVKV